MRRAAPRAGFTLIEIMCVIVLIGVLGIVTTILIKTTLDAERAQAAGFDRTMQVSNLADEFRADVNRAEATLPEFLDFQANARTLILKMKSGHVVYHWDDGQLQRRAFEGGKVTERTIPVGGPQVAIEFFRPGPNARTVRLRIDSIRNGEVREGHSLEIAAGLGGDWR